MADPSLTWDWNPFEESTLVSPTDDEQEMILPTVDPRPMLAEVVQIDETISKLEAELSSLRLKRLKVLADNALINSVPPEVLSRIFELGVHESQQLLPVISLVSKYWRELALATPTLWSYITMDHDWNYGHGAELLRKIRTYMDRAQAAKILVDLDFRYAESLAEARAIMQALNPHLARCFSFRVSVPDWDWMAVVAEQCDNMHASLEALALRIDPGDSEDAAPVPLLDGVYPRLTSVTLEQMPLACVFAKGYAPHLRQFHLVRDVRYHANQRIKIALREYLSALTSAPDLEDVRLQSTIFYLDGSEGLFQRSPVRTHVMRVTDLALSFLDATNVGLLLDAVTLPSLVRLAVQMDSGLEGDNLSWLSHLSSAAIAGRLPAFRHLELRTCTTEGAALAPLVRALHSLSQITALGLAAPPSGAVGSRLFELLASGPGNDNSGSNAWLLPNLRVLSLNGCRDVSGHEVLRVVRSRASRPSVDLGGVEKIRMVRIVPCYSLDPEVIEALRQNVDELRIVQN
ncbi:uncharacterized protein FOMMEDRAFT_31951 [Fomitiporia mediterranea MF3/22]|uniref:uncharacterized protein n=1 Tax=Fomitiporia mediterranea (strain MF3/22) TaxID=694068 RepID=UPI0004408D10|nr:uncharacterized protein FOMMEDRAFT_31951 [Fomitiporia mediterranea MF3/22]EJC98174.1 hypothetical protein FOMMEDRAFT_31951 [Fomitiporia mediterranea MF3/22]